MSTCTVDSALEVTRLLGDAGAGFLGTFTTTNEGEFTVSDDSGVRDGDAPSAHFSVDLSLGTPCAKISAIRIPLFITFLVGELLGTTRCFVRDIDFDTAEAGFNATESGGAFSRLFIRWISGTLSDFVEAATSHTESLVDGASMIRRLRFP
jgi:hypothetical protein